MKGKRLIILLTLASVSIAIEKRKVLRPNGQLKIINHDSDDSEMMQLEESGSKNKNKVKTEQDKVKTLSQQVADGKYGLIQKELFSKPPKRPGILSYELNPEVPNDTILNLGGLDKNEIWLAENHLLVLKGGSFPPYDDKKEHGESLWQPFDTYKAPLHQVKIPKNPKVPPPFPVQLTENGPLQILGTNFSRTINETDQPSPYSLPTSEGFPTGQKNSPFDPNSPNSSPGSAPVPIPIINPGEFPPRVSFPSPNLNETWPPFLGYLPPSAVILPPPGNQTDLYDDDDPSIYYPPPYSFYFPQDNSSSVPAGPLVPGIILPPPPNFFAWLAEPTIEPSNVKQTSPPKYKKPTTSKPNNQIYPTISSMPVSKYRGTTTQKPFKVYPIKNEHFTTEKMPTTEKSKVITNVPVHNRTYLPARANKPYFVRKNPQNITILRPVRPKTTSPPTIHLLQNEIPQRPNPVLIKNPIVSTTQVPLKYFSNDIGTHSAHQSTYRNKSNIELTKTSTPAQYYYYEEPELKVNTPKPPIQSNNYYGGTEGFYIPPRTKPPTRQRKPQYIYVTGKPYNTQKPRFRFIQQPVKTDTYSIHIANLQNQIRQYYPTIRTTKRPSPKPVYQFSFEAANYQGQNLRKRPTLEDSGQNEFKPISVVPAKYSVQIQQAIEIFPTEAPKYNPNPLYYQGNFHQPRERPQNYYTTPKPDYQFKDVAHKAPYYQQVTTPRPILEYSFEVTQNPVYQGFYTKPDEGFFDENTREYFTVFGKKLPSGTTPLPRFPSSVTESYSSPSEQTSIYHDSDKFQQKPVSLESDTAVNYLNPRPNVNAQAESIRTQTSHSQQNYPNVKYSSRPPQYTGPRPIKNQDPEIIKAIEVPVSPKESQDGSYISYELPGDDGAHFYFLTPQLTQAKEQGSRFYYSQSNSKRRRRDEFEDDKNR